jgi:uncharacterized phage infection (PIP) family protein YhgE
MDHRQRDARNAAARAFLDSLDQLGSHLKSASEDTSSSTQASSSQGDRPQGSANTESELEALEAAAADIEQFIRLQEEES